jgi:2,3-diketo-5-methylthio-1-phosphopentane phosphatase
MALKIVCDFDGTISLSDSVDAVLGALANPAWRKVERAWRDGLIGSAECMQRQIELLDADPGEIDAILDRIPVDPGFGAFAAFCESHGVALEVVSDGVDYFARRIMARAGFAGLPLCSNRLIQLAPRRYSLAFPHGAEDCASQAGTCKCLRARTGKHGFLILIGDGRSDFCVAHEADLVFAKGALLDHCAREGLIHAAFTGFADVLARLEEAAREGRKASSLRAAPAARLPQSGEAAQR